MFLTVKLKKMIYVLFTIITIIFFIIFVFGTVRQVNISVKPVSKCVVVIDAGHGGIDGGCVGKTTGITESELNLEYTLNLAKQLEQMNIACELTRKTSDGLYDINAKNLKRSEMLKRQEIIEKSNPKIVLSIHMNSFPKASTKGAKCFYKKGNEEGRVLAECIQGQLKINMPYVNGLAKVGDYYILNCTDIPAVLVECGFLSNSEDEINLQNKSYQDKICYSILSGIVTFLNR